MNLRRSFLKISAIGALFCLSTQPFDHAMAQSVEFTGGGDGFSWNDGDNWSGGTVPGADPNGDSIIIEGQGDVRVDSPTTAGGPLVIARDSTLNINAATTFFSRNVGGVRFSSSTINVNADTDIGGLQLGNGVLNLNGGVFSGDLLVSDTDASAPASQINQNGGRLNLESLSIGNNLSITLDGGDSISNSAVLQGNAQLTVNSEQNLPGNTSSVQVGGNATLNLNADLTVGTFNLDGTLNRAAGVGLDVNRLSVAGVEYDLDGNDTVRTFLDAEAGATINVLAPVVGPPENSFGFNLDVRDNSTVNVDTASTSDSFYNGVSAAESSTINVNANTTVSNALGVSSGSTLNVNADLTLGTTNGLIVRSGVVNLNDGTVTGRVDLSDRSQNVLGAASVVNRSTNAVLDLDSLSIQGDTQLTLESGDIISRNIFLRDGAELNGSDALVFQNLQIDDGSVFNFFQADGQIDGLTITSLNLQGGVLNIVFDDVAVEGLDFGLALSGDFSDELQGFLDDGSITVSGGSQPIGVIFDGTTTFLGFNGVAVPEPRSASVVLLASCSLFCRRRRAS